MHASRFDLGLTCDVYIAPKNLAFPLCWAHSQNNKSRSSSGPAYTIQQCMRGACIESIVYAFIARTWGERFDLFRFSLSLP